MDVPQSHRPLGEFSLMDPAVLSDPYPFYERLHAEAPVHRLNDETGFYIVAGYDLCREVLRDHRTFSNNVESAAGLGGPNAIAYEEMIVAGGWGHVSTLQRSDPPDHGRYRKLVDRVFTASRVRSLAEHVDRVTNGLIDGFIDDGEVEVIRQFALPMPGIIIAEQIGLDRSEIWTFKKWADALVGGLRTLDAAGVRKVADIELEMQHYLAKEIAARRATPRDDLLSALVHAGADSGEELSMHELQNVMHQLISGGYETTTTAIGTGIWLMIRYPEQAARVRADRSLLKGFIEEALRFESPVQGLVRQTTREVDLGGVTIPKGAVVVVRYGAANRDPARFACPHQFDIARQNAGGHMAFGAGTHFCPGAMLARQEMASAFTAFLDRMDDLRLARPLPDLPRGPNLMQFPIKQLPVAFTKIH